MWEVVFAVVLSIFLTCTLFLLVYGMAFVIVYKTIDWIQKINKKIKEPKLTEEDRKRREKEVFGHPEKSRSFSD